MTEPNPYQSPDSSPFETGGGHDWDSVIEDASRSLAQTKPWVLFLSILGFICSAFCMVVMPFVVLFGVGAELDGPERYAMLLPALMAVGMVVLCYLIPSVLLWKYGRRIGEFLQSRDPAGLAAALAAQKRFWRYFGIMVLVVTVLYFLMALLLPIMLTLTR